MQEQDKNNQFVALTSLEENIDDIDIKDIVFFEFKNFPSIFNHKRNMKYFCIIYPEDETSYYDYTIPFMIEMYKCTKGKLGKKVKLSDFLEAIPNYCIRNIDKCEYLYTFIKNKTNKQIRDMLKKNGLIIQYVKQNKKRCNLAIQQNPLALEYIKKQDEDMCLLAVSNNGLALEHVIEQTDNICMKAVENNGYSLQFVKKQTYEICKKAIDEYAENSEFINKDDPNLASCINELLIYADNLHQEYLEEQERYYEEQEIRKRRYEKRYGRY